MPVKMKPKLSKKLNELVEEFDHAAQSEGLIGEIEASSNPGDPIHRKYKKAKDALVARLATMEKDLAKARAALRAKNK